MFYRILIVDLFFIAVLALGTPAACARSQAGEDPWQEEGYREQYLRENVRAEYDFGVTAATKEEAILCFLRGELDAEAGNPCLVDERQYKTMIWPNFPDRIVRTPTVTPQASWTFEDIDRQRFLPRIGRLKSKPVALLGLSFPKNPDYFNSIIFHYPAIFQVRLENGSVVFIEGISAIVEHRGRFKVAQIGGD